MNDQKKKDYTQFSTILHKFLKTLCVIKCECSHLTLTDLATQFKCGISTVGDILKEKERWLAIQDNSPDANVNPPQMAKARRSNDHLDRTHLLWQSGHICIYSIPESRYTGR